MTFTLVVIITDDKTYTRPVWIRVRVRQQKSKGGMVDKCVVFGETAKNLANPLSITGGRDKIPRDCGETPDSYSDGERLIFIFAIVSLLLVICKQPPMRYTVMLTY